MILIRGILSVLLLAVCQGQRYVDVNTTLGVIKGAKMETRMGTMFLAFRGIPYAEAPVGELRFQNPQPVKGWKEKSFFHAHMDHTICPQPTETRMSWLSENCLRLNVYTKDLNTTNCLKPVIVYLHPGEFYEFTAVSAEAGPQHFMERDIVLVTVNYRLGSLGFLATGTADAPGNMGLKDQVIALRWIQEHIENFGGDPNSVTLWGYSAGSISIGLHMLSPMSKGLFHRAIMQSGSPLAQFRYRTNQTELAVKQAKLLKCPVTTVKDMMECLKTKNVSDFIDTTAAMFQFEGNPVLNWLPVVEEDYGQERFLVEDPYKTMLSGNINKVPIITGITEYEFYNLAYHTLRNDTQRQRFNQDFAKYNPIYFLYERNTPKSSSISKEMRSFYFQNKNLEFPQSLARFGELYSDGLICFEYHRFLQVVSKHVPVYTYLFTYKGRYSYFTDPDTNLPYGAVHNDELLYLLYVPPKTPKFSRTDPENNIIERLTRMWYEFAKKSDPNNPSDEYLEKLQWPLYDDAKKQYLEIGDELNVKANGIYPERMQFWDCLFPIQDFAEGRNQSVVESRCGLASSGSLLPFPFGLVIYCIVLLLLFNLSL